jgi:tRNA threonylcarbamoyladenosine biosynthesis protein TsaE
MNTEQTWQTESTSLESTLKLAAQVGQRLKGGEVIELVSDLGGGKTSFVQGLAAGLGSDDKVHSPSFTLTNQYKAGDLTLYHYDFYRLSEPGIMANELEEVLDDPKSVVVIEWAELVEDVLPADRLTVRIKVTSEDSRQFDFSFPESLKYLVPH